MQFMPAAWQVKVARVAQERWNMEHPDQFTPWEWIEETLLAWRACKEQASYAPQKSEEAHQRYLEFSRKLPPLLLREIFPKAEP